MKKIHLLGAAFIAATLSVGFASCGNDDDDVDVPVIGETVEKTDEIIRDLPAVTIPAVKDIEFMSTVRLLDAPVSEVYLLDGGKAIARTMMKSESRAAGGDLAEGTYVVNTDGSVTATIAGFTITVSADKNMAIINDTEYAAEVASAKADATTATLCRTWYPTEYNLVLYAGSKAIGNYKSASLLELQAVAAREIGTKVNLLSDEVNSITFMSNNTIVTNYKGTDSAIATWTWTNEGKGELKASFSSVDRNLMDIPAFARFKSQTPNVCHLVSAFKVDATGKGGEAFTADLKLIITMKDAK